MKHEHYTHRAVRSLGAMSVAALATLLMTLTAACSSMPRARPLQPTGEPLVHAVLGVGITVQDLDSSVAFYHSVLGFECIAEREESGEGVETLTGVFGVRRRVATMRLGDELVELTDYLAPEGQPVPTDFHSNDRWFQHCAIVVSDMDRAYAHLRKHNVRHASTGPQTLPLSNPNAGGIRAFYFKDPDGHPLELIWFPAGKGDPRWPTRAASDPRQLFLGIDHTAIVVADTDSSLQFYRETLGLRVAGASENIGIEQARLNNVRDAHLRITGLRAGHGMGVELLEYLNPRSGKPYPSQSTPNDLIHYETIVATNSLSATPLRSLNTTAPADPDDNGPQPQQVMLRDVDGHSIVVRERAVSQ